MNIKLTIIVLFKLFIYLNPSMIQPNIIHLLKCFVKNSFRNYLFWYKSDTGQHSEFYFSTRPTLNTDWTLDSRNLVFSFPKRTTWAERRKRIATTKHKQFHNSNSNPLWCWAIFFSLSYSEAVKVTETVRWHNQNQRIVTCSSKCRIATILTFTFGNFMSSLYSHVTARLMFVRLLRHRVSLHVVPGEFCFLGTGSK